MTSTTRTKGVKELAGGSITERKGTPIPIFLKLSQVGFCAFAMAYLFRYWAGEVDHPTRGAFVEEGSRLMQVPGIAWQRSLAVILGVFIVGLLWYVFFHKGDDD